MSRKVVAPLRREQILNGLFAAMSKKGFDAVSISDIARESGVARGVLHYYFTNKDEMLAALMRSLADTYFGRLERYMRRQESPAETLRAFFRYHALGDARAVNNLTGVWVEYWGKAAGGHAVSAIVSDLQAKIRRLLEAALRNGQKDGAIRKVNPKTVAVAMLGAVEGVLLQWRVNGRLVGLKETLDELERMVMCLSPDQSQGKTRNRRTRRGKGVAGNG